MKVLLLNGSPRIGGNTALCLEEMEKVFAANGIETETVQFGNKDIRGCVACLSCKKNGKCVFDDMVNETAPKFQEADGLVIGAPVYFGSANGSAMTFLQRLFYSTPGDTTMKVGAAFAVARRGGMSSTWDELNKFFAIRGMPIASGQYWSGVHGADKGEASQDEEGMQQMRTLASNMAFLMKSIALGREKFGLPEKEPFTRTNFVR